MENINKNKNENSRRKIIIATIVAVAVIIALIILLLQCCNGTAPAGPAGQTSSETGSGGNAIENTSSDDTSSDDTAPPSDTDVGDINGDPEKPGKTDSSSKASSKADGTSSAAVSRDNSVGSQPTPPLSKIGGMDGYVNTPDYKRDYISYDEYRYYSTLPTNYASLLQSAFEFMREPIMFNKPKNVLDNDFQQLVTQTGQYTFQHAGMTCTNPMEANFVKYQGNPALWGQNVYTPWFVKKGDTWYIYYGGWGTVDCVGNDTTYLATTKDPYLRGPYTQHGVVLKAGGDYVHAQDPAVDIGPNGKWVMTYTQTTIKNGSGLDWIGVATSDDGITWTSYGNNKTGISDTVSSEMGFTNYTRQANDMLGRPSMQYNHSKNRWEMYVDSVQFAGNTSQSGFIYFFTCTDAIPKNWKFEGMICQGGETALAYINDTYYLAYRNDTSWPSRMVVASSTDGMNFSDPSIFLTGERTRDGAIHNITQMAFAVDNNEIVAVMYGRSFEGWSHHVSLAWPMKKIEVWRGGQYVKTEPLATGPHTQVISSGGASAPLTKIRVYDKVGQPASLEAPIKLYSGQSLSLIKNSVVSSKPVLCSPVNNEIKVLWGPTLYWKTATMASKYTLQIATDAAFNNMVLNRLVLIEEYTLQDALELGTKYYWRVIAGNSQGSATSDVYSFTVLKNDEVRGELIQLWPDKVTASDDIDSTSHVNHLSDGPYYTHWSAAFDEDDPPSFTMDYGKQYPIAKVYWQARTDFTGWPTGLKLEYSIDGKTYFQITDADCITTKNFAGFPSDYNPKHILFKQPFNARYLRVTITNTSFSPVAGMAEFRAMILR